MGSNFSATPAVTVTPSSTATPSSMSNGDLQVLQDGFANFSLDTFKQDLEKAAESRKVQLIWRTAEGDGTGLWNYNMGIRKRTLVNGCETDKQLKTSDEILDELQRQSAGGNAFSLYLRISGRDDQILYFNVDKDLHADEKLQEVVQQQVSIEASDVEKFKEDLLKIAKDAGVTLLLADYGTQGWHYNVSVEGRSASDVFLEMMAPTDRTNFVRANLRIELSLEMSHPCHILLYYSFADEHGVVIQNKDVHIEEKRKEASLCNQLQQEVSIAKASNEEHFKKSLVQIAKDAGVALVMVNNDDTQGWQYNISVEGRSASDVFIQMIMRTDRTNSIRASLRSEPSLSSWNSSERVLYYSFIDNSAVLEAKHQSVSLAKASDDEKFKEDLLKIAQDAGVTLQLVDWGTQGWHYNVSVKGRSAFDVFTKMMVPTDRTNFIRVHVRCEPSFNAWNPCDGLLYYSFGDEQDIVIENK